MTLVLVMFVLTTAPASAHLVAKPHGKSLNARATSQTTNLKHARYVCRHGHGHHKRWSCEAKRWLARELAETEEAIERNRQRRLARMDPIAAIRMVWGPNASAAIAVARCETGGTFSVYAQNGQYLGMFQMGDWARARYGHGYTAIEQARAAYRNFLDNGWGQWECARIVGIR